MALSYFGPFLLGTTPSVSAVPLMPWPEGLALDPLLPYAPVQSTVPASPSAPVARRARNKGGRTRTRIIVPKEQLVPLTYTDATGQAHWQCPVAGCGKDFARAESVRLHFRVHTGERPYTCPFPDCGRSYAHRSGYTIHLKTHARTEVPLPADDLADAPPSLECAPEVVLAEIVDT